jgi:hypothetical protein
VVKIDTPKSKPVEFKPINQVASAIVDTTPAAPHKVAATAESTQPKTEKKPVPIRDDKPVKTKAVEPPVKQPEEAPKAAVKPKEVVKPVEAPHTATNAVKPSAGKESVYFTVQLLAAKHKPGNYDDLVNTFGLIDREDIADGVVRYMAGEFATFGEAKKALELAHSKGIKDAFIVGYLNKKRLDGKGTFQLGTKYP